MLNFFPGAGVFAVAGVAAAPAPVVIHLLNRRRYRVIDWAAMQFLLEALQRNRKPLQVRDVLLLVLRTAALVLFGLALARPFFSGSSSALQPNQPVHAVLVIDNSLSMGEKNLDGSSRLDEAKDKCKAFVKELPEGSLISVLPLCGSAAGYSREGYRGKRDATGALDRIEVVDRSGSAVQAADLALAACKQHAELPTKRIAFVGDQQRINWPAGALAAQMKELPELQVASIVPKEPLENTWIATFFLQDGIADLESPAVFVAVVRHEGPSARKAVEVVLSIDGTKVNGKIIDLEPGQAREIIFEHRFDVAVDEGKPAFVPVEISLPHDRLHEDDARFLVVPVLAALPIVFIDQYGPEEDPRINRYGETWHLRRLLAPSAQGAEARPGLVKVKHIKIEQLVEQGRPLLEDARLVIVAGVPSPGRAVSLLRDFVKQGGQLLITAGAGFDPAAWHDLAWLDGAGILPAPLDPKPIGQLPGEAGKEIQPFFLSFDSMAHDYFHLADTPRAELEALYRLPYFFKAVSAKVDESVLQALRAAESKRIEEERSAWEETERRQKQWAAREAKGKLTETDRREREENEERRSALNPSWLLWKNPSLENAAARKPAELAERSLPRVLAAFDNQVPFLIQRSIGQGQIVFVSTGVFPGWNTLAKTNTIVLLDRVLRGMLVDTLPRRNLTTSDSLQVPVTDRDAQFALIRPDRQQESLSVDALGSDLYGLALPARTTRGIYKIVSSKSDAGTKPEASSSRLWEIPVAVNGPAEESEPALLDEQGLKGRLGNAPFRWLGPGDSIRIEGAQVQGQNMWKILIVLVMVCLLAELAIVAWPLLARERAP